MENNKQFVFEKNNYKIKKLNITITEGTLTVIRGRGNV